MRAKRGNRSYVINDNEVNSFKQAGYDIYDDNGKLVSYGVGRTISLAKYEALRRENIKLKDQVDALAEKIEQLKKASKKEK